VFYKNLPAREYKFLISEPDFNFNTLKKLLVNNELRDFDPVKEAFKVKALLQRFARLPLRAARSRLQGSPAAWGRALSLRCALPLRSHVPVRDCRMRSEDLLFSLQNRCMTRTTLDTSTSRSCAQYFQISASAR
jgi:hypothetical protein